VLPDSPEHEKRGGWKLKKAAIWMLALSYILAVSLLVLLIAATALGWRIGGVASGSMEPDLGVGQLVVTRPVEPNTIKSGDVIAFRSLSDPDTIITHRVISTVDTGDGISFQTKGDANRSPDQLLVPPDNVEGRVTFHVPHVGYPISYAQTLSGFTTFVAITLLTLVGAVIIRGVVSRIRREPETAPAPAQ
jgi:signal peptidase